MPSAIESEKTGINTLDAVNTISVIPYCSVVKTYVYKGTKKNCINFDPKLPIKKIIVLFINLFDLFFI